MAHSAQPRSPRRPRRWPLVVALLASVAGVAAVAAWWRRPPPDDAAARRRIEGRRPAPGGLNLVVLTLDTLRADRLGCYGFKEVETPHIDGLAGEGVVFEQVSAVTPLTFPSHASIFTGLLPPHHGVRDNGGFFLDDSRTTLAERLQKAGFATGAFVGAWVLESKWGLAQGFDRYSDRFDLSKYKTLSLGSVQKPGDEVMDDALAWLDTVAGRRFFAWVHLYDPHTPYEPPEPYASRYAGRPYVGEIAYTDAVVGRLVAWLRQRGLLERTLIVLTADHGESLGEHGESTHAFFIYDATVHVPLVIRTPWGDHGRVTAQASSVDIMPTVIDLLGLAPEAGLDGRSLARLVLDPAAPTRRAAYSETYFPRYHFGWQHLRGMRDGRYKFIDAPEPELYDLLRDPGETQNVYTANSLRADELRREMERVAGAEKGALPERAQLDPESLERLAALGYVGNVREVDPTAVLPDPKSKIGVFALMGAAKSEADEGRFDKAIARMREVLARDGGIVDAHITLGNWLARQGDQKGAVGAFRTALELDPRNEIALLNMANAYRAQGRTDSAIEGYRTALRLDPKSPQTWYQLATLFLDSGRLAEAEGTFRQALQNNPRMGAAYSSLGAIAFSRGQADEAERLVRKALELEPDHRTAHFTLGRILEARGDLAGAEQMYRAELASYPDHGRARFNLAQLQRQRGDGEGYRRELQALVEKAPEFGPGYFFLAREELRSGRLERAAELARKGVQLDSRSELAPLGFYVLADVYSRQGEAARAQAEVARARRLEAELKRNPPPRI